MKFFATLAAIFLFSFDSTACVGQGAAMAISQRFQAYQNALNSLMKIESNQFKFIADADRKILQLKIAYDNKRVETQARTRQANLNIKRAAIKMERARLEIKRLCEGIGNTREDLAITQINRRRRTLTPDDRIHAGQLANAEQLLIEEPRAGAVKACKESEVNRDALKLAEQERDLEIEAAEEEIQSLADALAQMRQATSEQQSQLVDFKNRYDQLADRNREQVNLIYNEAVLSTNQLADIQQSACMFQQIQQIIGSISSAI